MIGVITDGDIRRGLEENGDSIFEKTAEFLMSKNPKWIDSDTLAISALRANGKTCDNKFICILELNNEKA